MTKQIEEGLKQVQQALADYTKAIIAAVQPQPAGAFVQAGTHHVGNATGTTTISFPKRFPSPPVVVANALKNAHGNVALPVHVMQVSDKDFMVAHHYVQPWELHINWIATLPTATAAATKSTSKTAVKAKAPARKAPARKGSKV